MLTATYHKKTFVFTETRHTSRDSLRTKPSFFIKVINDQGELGIGECSYLKGLSPEPWESYESKVKEVCENIHAYQDYLDGKLNDWPSIQFGLETAIKNLKNKGFNLFDTPFARGESSLIINGLIWMDDYETMKRAIDDKINQGFSCIKLKIGAIDFQKELDLLAYIRKQSKEITIRVDANGAFSPDEALDKLHQLANYDIHSIEQPIKQGQWEQMKALCKVTPIPIALDEELIGLFESKKKEEMLHYIQPHFIILKPSLVGGFKGTEEWINLAKNNNIGWWITSCLESNIGLNAIAQFVSQYEDLIPQGLGTGQIYTNNIPSGLSLEGEKLNHHVNNWNLDDL